MEDSSIPTIDEELGWLNAHEGEVREDLSIKEHISVDEDEQEWSDWFGIQDEEEGERETTVERLIPTQEESLAADINNEIDRSMARSVLRLRSRSHISHHGFGSTRGDTNSRRNSKSYPMTNFTWSMLRYRETVLSPRCPVWAARESYSRRTLLDYLIAAPSLSKERMAPVMRYFELILASRKKFFLAIPNAHLESTIRPSRCSQSCLPKFNA